MFKTLLQNIALAFILLTPSLAVNAQTVTEPKTKPEWSQLHKPFRIGGNLYYVGTYDLACYLITTTKGNILINTGLAASAAQIKSNIEALGFKFADTKILLTSQAHYDHVGAMADIKKLTGAKLMADEKDAQVLATGGAADYEMGKYGTTFKRWQQIVCCMMVIPFSWATCNWLCYIIPVTQKVHAVFFYSKR